MKVKKPAWVRMIDWISEVSGYISGIAIFIAALIVCEQVIIRLFGLSTIWQTELTTYLIIFATFVGSAYTLKHDGHIGVDVIVEILPTKAKTVLRLVTSAFSLIVALIVAYKGWGMWYEATVAGWKSDTIWAPPLSFPYFMLPLGMTLICFQYIALIYEESRKLFSHSTVSTTNVKTGPTHHEL